MTRVLTVTFFMFALLIYTNRQTKNCRVKRRRKMVDGGGREKWGVYLDGHGYEIVLLFCALHAPDAV